MGPWWEENDCCAHFLKGSSESGIPTGVGMCALVIKTPLTIEQKRIFIYIYKTIKTQFYQTTIKKEEIIILPIQEI